MRAYKIPFLSIAVGRITNDLFCISNEIDCKSLIAFYFLIGYAMPEADFRNVRYVSEELCTRFRLFRIRRDFPLPVGRSTAPKVSKEISP